VSIAIVIPADPAEPARQIELDANDPTALSTALGGALPSTARYDRDAICFVDDNFVAKGLPINPRATTYMLTESDAAKAGRMANASPDYVLAGPVIMSGITDGGELADVPARLVEHFDALPIRPTGRGL
jgi:hypothetical protein